MDGTGGLMMDGGGGTLEPSPKRRHSDSYASSSTSPFHHQFSPANSSDTSSQGRSSRVSSMSSSQDAPGAATYHHGAWGTSSPVSITLAPPAPSTTYGVLRMSGGGIIQPVNVCDSLLIVRFLFLPCTFFDVIWFCQRFLIQKTFIENSVKNYVKHSLKPSQKRINRRRVYELRWILVLW